MLLGDRSNLTKINMKTLTWIATLLMVIGAINWGLVGLFNFDLVSAIFGSIPTLETIVYILVGISGLWGISLLMPKKPATGPMM